MYWFFKSNQLTNKKYIDICNFMYILESSASLNISMGLLLVDPRGPFRGLKDLYFLLDCCPMYPSQYGDTYIFSNFFNVLQKSKSSTWWAPNQSEGLDRLIYKFARLAIPSSISLLLFPGKKVAMWICLSHHILEMFPLLESRSSCRLLKEKEKKNMVNII